MATCNECGNRPIVVTALNGSISTTCRDRVVRNSGRDFGKLDFGIGPFNFNLQRRTKAGIVNRNVDAVLQYWRTSLADGALGQGKFSQRDRKRFIEV